MAYICKKHGLRPRAATCDLCGMEQWLKGEDPGVHGLESDPTGKQPLAVGRSLTDKDLEDLKDSNPGKVIVFNKDPKSRHYDAGGIETLEVIRAKLTPEQFKGFLLGNIIKYSCRLNFKDQAVRDSEKIGHYQKFLKEVIK